VSPPTVATRLLDHAESLLAGEPPGCAPSLRQRAAALLARQALEELLAQLWRRREPGMEGASMRPQLTVLGAYVREGELVARVAWAWGILSAATHGDDHTPSTAADAVRVVRLLPQDAALT
jgi:hypothetical protein